MNWTVDDIPNQNGRVAIVTGANSGIGFYTAQALAGKGALVILACRNLEKADAARTEMLSAHPTANLLVAKLDLSDLSSVKTFAADFLAEHDRLDLLINNAGVMTPPRGQTADGFETQFGTNHLGHFALTGHLLERLISTKHSRVVTVSSLAHRLGRIHFDDLNFAKRYRKVSAYGQSKLANLMFAIELNRRLQKAGHDAVSVAAHPGWTATNLQDNMRFARAFNPYLAQRGPAGALPTLYAAVAEGAEEALYFGPKGAFELKGAPDKAHIARHARDEDVAAQLWEVSEQLTNVSFGL